MGWYGKFDHKDNPHSGENISYDEGFCDGHEAGERNCAAGPWQPMSTVPQGQKILVKVKLHGVFHVFVAKRHASSWEYFPEDNISYLSMYGDIVAWAAINTQEEKTE